MRDVQRAIPTQDQQGIQFQFLDSIYDLIRNINSHFLTIADHLPRVGIPSVCRAEDRPAASQDSAYCIRAQRNNAIFFNEAIISIFDSEDFTAIFINGGLHRRADDRIQTRRIAATRKNSNSFHRRTPLPYCVYDNTVNARSTRFLQSELIPHIM